VIVGRHKAPYYFHKVISASVEDGSLVVQGDPASIDDAIESADITASVGVGENEEPGKFDIWQQEYTVPAVDYYRPNLYEVRDPSGTVHAKVGTTPNSKIELRGRYEVELRISPRERFFKLTLTGKLTGGLGIDGEVDAARKFQKSVPLLKDMLQINMISLLGIPVKVSANFVAHLDAGFDASARFRVSRTISSKTVVFMQFENGKWVSGQEEQPDKSEIDDDLRLELQGKAYLTAGVESQFSVGLGGEAFGAGVEADSRVTILNQLKLAADGKLDTANPQAGNQITYGVDACTDVDLYATVGFHAFMYNKKHDWKRDLYAKCWDLADGKYPPK
jgi:hypothetical protein